MNIWRKKAKECIPEFRKEIENPKSEIDALFLKLLPATIQAHKKKENEKLQRYYDFSEWCFRRKEEELWNAAGVLFYQCLGDQEETFIEMTNWISSDIYHDIRGLLEIKMDKIKLKNLDDYYGEVLRNSIKEAFNKNLNSE